MKKSWLMLVFLGLVLFASFSFVSASGTSCSQHCDTGSKYNFDIIAGPIGSPASSCADLGLSCGADYWGGGATCYYYSDLGAMKKVICTNPGAPGWVELCATNLDASACVLPSCSGSTPCGTYPSCTACANYWGNWQVCAFLTEPNRTDCYSHECNVSGNLFTNSGGCDTTGISGTSGKCSGAPGNRIFCDDTTTKYITCAKNVANAIEYCNGIDDNCNGLIDDNPACIFFTASLDKGLIAYWPFDVATGSNSTFAKDVVNGNNGTVYNLTGISSISLVPSGIKGQAYDFPTSVWSGTPGKNMGNAVKVQSNTLLGNIGNSFLSYSIMGWFKVKGNKCSGTIINKNTGYGKYPFDIQCDHHGVLHFALYDGGTIADNLYSTGLIVDNNWHQIVAVRNASKISIYLDGNLNSNGTTSVGGTSFNCDPIYIGNSDNSGAENNCQPGDVPLMNPFNGTLDEIAIWNRSLNSSEVQQLFNFYRASSYCGNGIIEIGEVCDDNNTNIDDGCSNCNVDSGWTCITNSLGTSVCNLINVPVRNATCSGSIPANATLNDGGLGGNFTQTFIDGVWSPPEKNFSIGPGEACGFECNPGLDWDYNSKSCVGEIPAEIISCIDIHDKDSCNADTTRNRELAKNDYGSDVACGQTFKTPDNCTLMMNCLCGWRGENTGCNADEAYTTLVGPCSNDSYKSSGTCELELSLSGNCETSSEIIINKKATWIDGFPKFNCTDRTDIYKCPNNAKLSFFSDISLVLAILLIILVYFYLTRKIRKKNK